MNRAGLLQSDTLELRWSGSVQKLEAKNYLLDKGARQDRNKRSVAHSSENRELFPARGEI